ncbi:sigma-70 family RNA polymerase sigma factor [Emticicia sp. CRIBPO]|uniref:RNA polymerase sigma factor n=1 Tax=Emticicia sp. CRIBPO TaxID=2683258 RepID=UPI001413668A|nr:sigma-70 family RNA polymerase sigma factor [Emticicia sp. CRIBPO]NBA85246.1 sigma-70 family RNA polymerase sigma factor [Emticicia sp. CRIBPO]
MIFKRRNKDSDLSGIIEGCVRKKPLAERELFDRYANFGKNICMRYASSDSEAEEMLCDGFLKIFTNIQKYDLSQPFEAWFRTIMVHSAIDYFRKNHSRIEFTHLENARDIENSEEHLKLLSTEEIMDFVQRLSPVYRMVFSLSVVEGYSHQEISQLLGTTESAVRANLAKARANLQNWITEYISKQSKI